jgi:hypothetical protein
MAVDLVLGELGAYTPPSGDAVHILFGELEGAVGALTDSTFTVSLRASATMQAAQLQPFPGGTVRARWGVADPSHAARPALAWGVFDGGRPAATPRLPWSAFDGARPSVGPVLPWQPAPQAPRAGRVLPWRPADPRQHRAVAPWQAAGRTQRRVVAPWEAADPRQRRAAAPWGPAGRTQRSAVVPWGPASYLPAINRPRPGDPGNYGFEPRATGPVHLHFCEYATENTNLVLGGEVCVTQPRIPDGTVINARTTYMHTHSLTAFRLPDLAVVPLTDFSLSADDGSVGWTLSANGPVEVLTLLAPTGPVPARLRVSLDGMTWEFVVEGLRRTRAFGRTTATITARSATALLGAPYMAEVAYLNAVPVTAQQIIDDALAFTDVALDWQCTDWLVPAGAWSHTGTPLSVVARVAESIGAVVESPRTGDTVTVRPRYPVLPWAWDAGDVDVTIALDAVTSEGYERADRPAYEGVYVSGQAQGVLALIKRTGTAPSVLLPLVTDALITHLDAATQRGTALLGPTGPMATMTVTLPVLTGFGEPGVINPGKLVQLDGWIGLVRSVGVSASPSTVRQTLTLERHL